MNILEENNYEENDFEDFEDDYDWRYNKPEKIISNSLSDYDPETVLEPHGKDGKSLDFIFRVIDSNSVEVLFSEMYSQDHWSEIITCSRYCELIWDMLLDRDFGENEIIPVEKFDEWDVEENEDLVFITYAAEIKCNTISEAIEKSEKIMVELHAPLKKIMKVTEDSIGEMLKQMQR